MKKADRKANFLITLVFDENVDIEKQVDTEYAVKTYIKNGLQLIVGKEIKHFVIADDEVINRKLTEERKVEKVEQIVSDWNNDASHSFEDMCKINEIIKQE
ncbi:MAG: hypothetical protein J6S67_24030 [Methanobrevibacter sp.]|nr:hypothetical protein [Methanobrevibacter sp.]